MQQHLLQAEHRLGERPQAEVQRPRLLPRRPVTLVDGQVRAQRLGRAAQVAQALLQGGLRGGRQGNDMRPAHINWVRCSAPKHVRGHRGSPRGAGSSCFAGPAAARGRTAPQRRPACRWLRRTCPAPQIAERHEHCAEAGLNGRAPCGVSSHRKICVLEERQHFPGRTMSLLARVLSGNALSAACTSAHACGAAPVCSSATATSSRSAHTARVDRLLNKQTMETENAGPAWQQQVRDVRRGAAQGGSRRGLLAHARRGTRRAGGAAARNHTWPPLPGGRPAPHGPAHSRKQRRAAVWPGCWPRGGGTRSEAGGRLLTSSRNSEIWGAVCERVASSSRSAACSLVGAAGGIASGPIGPAESGCKWHSGFMSTLGLSE